MEVLAGVSIIAVLSSIILPQIGSLYSDEVVSAEALNLINNIRAARYRAIEEQAPHRVVFSDDFLTYRVQSFKGFDQGETVTLDDDKADSEKFTDTNWLSIIDDYEAALDPSIEVKVDSSLPKCVFCWPDGRLVTRINSGSQVSETNVTPIPECYIMLSSGNAGIRVVINTYGVYSSESFVPDSDASDDDSRTEIW